MKKIILHWTAGSYHPSNYDKQFYHFLIDKDGKRHTGNYRPEDNLNCNDGKYAAHTGGGNTGAIGVALCGMGGFISRDRVGFAPITREQIEGLFSFVAQLCRDYNIVISPETVLTHYEFGVKNPNTSSKGKIDIIYLPPFPDIKQGDIGDFIRSKIKWYYNKR